MKANTAAVRRFRGIPLEAPYTPRRSPKLFCKEHDLPLPRFKKTLLKHQAFLSRNKLEGDAYQLALEEMRLKACLWE